MGKAAAAALSGSAASPITGLHFLALRGAYRITDASVERIVRAAPGLTELRLSDCSRLQGPALEALPALIPGLRCSQVTVIVKAALSHGDS